MKKLFSISAVLFLAIAVVCVWQAWMPHTRVSSAIAQRTILIGKVHDAESRVCKAEHEQTELQATLDALRKAQPTPIATPQKKPSETFSGWNHNPLLTNNPKLQSLYLDYKQTEFAPRYLPLLKRLHLTPEETKKFEQLVMEREAQRLDLDDVSVTPSGAKNAIGMAAFARLSDDGFKTAQIALLGMDRYKQLREYERTLLIHVQVEDLAMKMATIDPITPQQAEWLVQTMGTANRGYQSGGNASQSEVDWDTVLPQARGMLSPTQLEMLKLRWGPNPASKQVWDILHLYADK